MDKNLTRKQAASFISDNYFPCAAATLAKFVTVGGGPKYIKIGTRRVMYQQSELSVWALTRMSKPVAHSSEYGTLYLNQQKGN